MQSRMSDTPHVPSPLRLPTRVESFFAITLTVLRIKDYGCVSGLARHNSYCRQAVILCLTIFFIFLSPSCRVSESRHS